MNRRLSIAVFLLLVIAPASNASAQLLAAKDGPIVYGHHHLNVSDMDAAKKFWVDALGGVLVIVGPEKREIIKFPNALMLLRAQKPTGGSKGSTVDHVGFSVKNLRQVVDRVKAGGYRMVTSSEAPPNVKVQDDIGIVEGGPVSGIAYVMAPDDTKVELVEMKAQAAPIASHHLHFAGMNKEMQAWYMQTFGAREAPSANPAAFVSASLPGVLLNFTPSASVVGTEGRVIDHIGFEVKGLEAFLKQLEAKGTKPTVTYRKIEALGIAIAFVTDPWGTRIELTEGLDKVN